MKIDYKRNMTGRNSGVVGMINKNFKELNYIGSLTTISQVVHFENVMIILVKTINFILKSEPWNTPKILKKYYLFL